MLKCNTLIAFDTAQYIEFLRWRGKTSLDSTHYEMIDIEAGYDPDYATGTYYCWNIWQLSEQAMQEYFYTKHTSTSFEWEQLKIDLDYAMCNWREGIRFP